MGWGSGVMGTLGGVAGVSLSHCHSHLPRLLIFPAPLLSTLTLELILIPAQTGRSRESQLASLSVFKCTPPPSPGGSGVSSVYGQNKSCLPDPWSPRSSEKPTGHLAFRPFLRSVLFHVLVLELETQESQDELRPYAPNSALADCLGDSARGGARRGLQGVD